MEEEQKLEGQPEVVAPEEAVPAVEEVVVEQPASEEQVA